MIAHLGLSFTSTCGTSGLERCHVSRIARNAPCPCGSGKKYKKCCLAKDEAASQEVGQAASAVKGEDRSPVPVGTGKGPHPYVVAKWCDDPVLLNKALFERGRRGTGKMRFLWTPRKLGAMSTEEIEERLRDLGVDPERERFLELAQDYTSAWALSEVWRRQIPGGRLDKAADDFLGIAACELWKRHCPERPSIEMLDDWMQEGYEQLEKHGPAQACDRWLELWRVLRERLTPSMRSTDDAEGLIAGTQYIFDWTQDFTDALHNASIDDLQYAELGIEFFRQALEKLPDEHSSNRRLFRTEKAFLHYRRGQDEEGERILLELIEQEPDMAAGYVCLSDELSAHIPGETQPRDLDRAIRLLEEALERPVSDAEDWDVERRLEYLRGER